MAPSRPFSNADGSQGLATSVATGGSSISATSGSISASTTLNREHCGAGLNYRESAQPVHRIGTTQPFTATGTFTDKQYSGSDDLGHLELRERRGSDRDIRRALRPPSRPGRLQLPPLSAEQAIYPADRDTSFVVSITVSPTTAAFRLG